MEPLCFYLLPLFAIVNTLVALFLVYKLFFNQLKSDFEELCASYFSKEFPLEDLVSQKLEPMRMLMQQRYDGFIEALKKRIPLADMVMTGAVAAGIKSQVQEEIDQLLPEIKKLLMERLMEPGEIRRWIKLHLAKQSSFEHFSDHLWRHLRWHLLLALIALSFLLGVVQIAIMKVFC